MLGLLHLRQFILLLSLLLAAVLILCAAESLVRRQQTSNNASTEVPVRIMVFNAYVCTSMLVSCRSALPTRSSEFCYPVILPVQKSGTIEHSTVP